MKLNSLVTHSKKMLIVGPTIIVVATGFGTVFAAAAGGSIPAANGTITGCYLTVGPIKPLSLIDTSTGATCPPGQTGSPSTRPGHRARRERPVRPGQRDRQEPRGPRGPPDSREPQAPRADRRSRRHGAAGAGRPSRKQHPVANGERRGQYHGRLHRR